MRALLLLVGLGVLPGCGKRDADSNPPGGADLPPVKLETRPQLPNPDPPPPPGPVEPPAPNPYRLPTFSKSPDRREKRQPVVTTSMW